VGDRLFSKDGSARKVAIVAAFKITILKGLEVDYLVIAAGAGGVGILIPTRPGALDASVLVG
jgi:uncharacterized membrane protein